MLALTARLRAAPFPETAAELYGLTNIWSIHLKFTDENWSALEPKNSGGMYTARPWRVPPADILVPTFMNEADKNRDRILSREEFAAAGQKWFAAWDGEKSGYISLEQLREGLNSTFMPFGGRMNLQGPEGKRNGIASRLGFEFEYTPADLQFESNTFVKVAARYKGNGTYLESQRGEKRPLKVDLNKYVKGQDLAGVTTLNLHNSVTDGSWMNESLALRLYRDAGAPAPRTAFARLQVTNGKFDGTYFGLYCLVENVDRHFTREYFGTRGGALFKPVTPDLFGDLGGDWEAYQQTYDAKTALTTADKSRLLELCRLVSKANDATFAARIAEFIDLEAFARYMAVTVFLSDLDGILGPGQNFYLYLHPATGKFHFIAWDQDHSFGQMRGTQEQRETLSIDAPWQGQNRFLERIFNVDAFKRLYRARLDEFSKTLFKPERFYQQVNQLAPIIRPAIKEESSEKLEDFDFLVTGGNPELSGYNSRRLGPGKPIKGFVGPRAKSIAEQLAGKAKGSRVPGDGIGPGMILGAAFMAALDRDKDNELTAEEVSEGFVKWFESWSESSAPGVSEQQLRDGINRDLAPLLPWPAR